jgi:DNA-binding transcriptional LysR family regulator
MNYRQLEIFRAVVDTGSATAAARLLELSQPAVSRQLAQIEADLGLELFARERGRLTPTAQALTLYGEAALAFEGLERVLNVAARLRSHQVGTLRVAAPYSAGEALLPLALSRLSASHRNLRYTLQVGNYETIAGLIARREADVGIVKEPLANPGVATLPLADSPVVCAIPPGHRLAGSRTITVDMIAGEPLILIGRNAPWRHDIHALFRRSGHQPLIRLETHAVGAACGFVTEGMGIAIVPLLLAAQYAGRGIVLRAFAADITHQFAVAYPAGLRRGGLIDEFVTAARSAARALLRNAKPHRNIETVRRSAR